ncbi:HAD-IIB family hydrolase [Spiroplasma culicicola]|uniref:HAD family hydrolase n=1 Tax=Spiroplasma culicicola AES-1 TaxID=1276246 RepID=W6A7F2_9MOLU|nr:HAD-IIB family hydrolase [Spiroplasma culicicola]AHI52770.1 HAD family hydrolase [Spiroplasma culicicola AES-1]
MMKLHSDNDYKFIIFDIGKTLFDKNEQKHISKNIISSILTLKSKGIKVGVCTMRTYDWCKKNVNINFDFYICLNGSYIVCNNKVIFQSRVENVFLNFDQLTYGSKTAFFKNYSSQNLAVSNGFVNDQMGILKWPFVIVLFNINSSSIKDFENKYNIYHWNETNSVALQNKKCSRVNGISKVLKYFNHNEKFLYFGDGPNDLEIFQKYDYCIMMGDGYHNLEKFAFAKTDSCSEEGVYKYLKQISII